MDNRSDRAIGSEDHGTHDVRTTPENNSYRDKGALQGQRRKTFYVEGRKVKVVWDNLAFYLPPHPI